MDVNAIAQAAQAQQSSGPAQDSGSGSAADMFAYLLKHQFGTNVGRHQLLNGQAAIDMVGTIQNTAPQAVLNTPAAALKQQTGPQTQNQSAGPANANNGPAANQTVTAANTNGGRNSNSGAQSNGAGSQNQQGPAARDNTDAPAAQNAGPAAATARAATTTGEDQATEETAAVIAAATYVVQQQTAPAPTVDPVAAVAKNGPAVAGPQQQSAGPVAGPAAAQAAQQLAAAAEDDVAPDSTHAWNANFLNSGPATPEIAQQAQGLAKITGQSGASISVQSTSGTSVAAPSTGTLVPEAVMAVPSFFGNGDQDASTGDGSGDQQTGQQSNDNAPQALIDPMAQALAQDMQALSAISVLLQGAAQNAVATQQSAGQSVASVSAAAAASDAALPQPTQAPQTQNGAPASNFVAQLQETEEPEQPQAPKQTTLPSAIDQIKMEIEKGVASGSTTIKVQLNPDNMGRVDVKLEVQGGQVKATISADHPETLALLKNDQAGMLQALQDAGLNADSNSLSFYLRGDQQRQFAQSGRQNGRGQQGGGAAAIDAVAGVSGTSAATGASAASSALDISV
jgi:hypothetical protein